MQKREAYSYTVLRYVHDVMTGEFVNIGIVIHGAGDVKAKFNSRTSRISGIFPGFDGKSFRTSLSAIKIAVGAQAVAEQNAGMFRSKPDAVAFADKAMISDDSSFQWSPAGSGVTSDLATTLEQLYGRFVSHYEKHAEQRRNDDDVWKPIRKQLDDLHVADKFVEKVFVGGFDEIKMEHAWKNGKWHGLQAYSLDLADEAELRHKVRAIRGQLDAAADGCSDDLVLNLILGAPSNPKLNNAYLAAKRNLESAGFNPKVLDENEAPQVVAALAKEIASYK